MKGTSVDLGRLMLLAKHTSCVLMGLAAAFGGGLAYATPPATAPAAGTELILLGTQGGPPPSPTRSQPSDLLMVNGRGYLIDVGDGTLRQLSKAGVPYRSIDHIFITHNHDDHNAGLGPLLGVAWTMGKVAPTEVIGPRGTAKLVSGLIEAFSANEDIRMAEMGKFYKGGLEDLVHVKEIAAGSRIYEDENVKVDAIQNCHFHFPADSKLSSKDLSFAYRFTTAQKTIVISGDTGPCPQLVDFARGADILVHEVISVKLMEPLLRSVSGGSEERLQGILRHMQEDHSTPEEVGKLAAKANVGMVVLTHLGPGNPEDPDEAYSAGVRKFYKGKVVVGRDLMRF